MRLFALLSAMTCAACALAVPAKPTPITYTQPDGTEITVLLRGDERSHFFLSEDGYLLARQNEAFYYGDIDAAGQVVASPRLARPAAARTAADTPYLRKADMPSVEAALQRQAAMSPRAAKAHADQAPDEAPAESASYGIGLMPGSHFPSTGSPKGVVFLVYYTDVEFTLDDPYSYFYNMLNQEGFSEERATGSVLDFFKENSSGVFTPEFDVYGPLELPHNRAYYGANDAWGNDSRPHEMALHACQILDDDVDFSQYDTNGDGLIDNIYIFYAGMGEASGGPANSVWPHSWEFSSGSTETYYFDGVQLEHYACSNEMERNYADGCGTFVHEFSHVLGLPDLYATSYTGAFTPGAWSALDYGPYNNDGRTPPNYGVFERNALGWMKPQVLGSDFAEYALPAIGSNEAFIIETGKPNEFFLLENRQKEGWDSYIPGHGMLAWHIDYNDDTWAWNRVNNTANHQYVDILEADNSQNEYNRDGDAFPGKSKVTSLTGSTKPALRTWGGQRLEHAINQIAEADGVITFTVGYRTPATPVATEATDVTPFSFIAHWEPAEYATGYRLSVVDANGASPKGWSARELGDVTSIQVDGLTPSTTYTYTVKGVNEGNVGEASNPITVTTDDATIQYYAVSVLPASDIDSDRFTANWEALDLAIEYFVDVYKVENIGGDEYAVNFDDGVDNLPEGWKSTTQYRYTTDANCGESAPSLRFPTPGYLESPIFDEPVTQVRFWHRGVNANEGNAFNVTGKNGSQWDVLASVPVNNEEGEVSTIDIPDGYHCVRIEYVEAVHKGSGAIDDVVVVVNGRTLVPLEGYSPRSAGNSLSLEITGLDSDTKYTYSVLGSDGELMSMPSAIVWVTTGDGAGIDSPVADAAQVGVSGREIILGAPGAVYSIDGRLVYTGSNGSVKVAPGIYVVRTAAGTAKVIVK